MPLSAVVEIDGFFVRARCGQPIVRHEFFLAEDTVDEPVPVNPYRIMAADGPADGTKVLENRIHGGAIHIEVDTEIDCGTFGLSDQPGLLQRGLCIGCDFRFCRTGIFQSF